MQHVKIPWDIEDAKQLGRVLDRYKDRYFFEVLLALVVSYILYPFPNSLSLDVLQTMQNDILHMFLLVMPKTDGVKAYL
jgi:hypothetical protein